MLDTGDDIRKLLSETELGLGTSAWGDRVMWNYGRSFNDQDLRSAFEISIQNGINFIDTAEVYGQGRSERLIGQFCKESETKAVIATKFFPFPWRFQKKSMERAIRGSLDRLEMDQVDLYQVHWPIPPRSVETWAEAFVPLVKQGLTRGVGVSNYNRNQMQRVYTVLSRYDIPLVSNQVEFSLLNRTAEFTGLLERCKELGVRLIAYSPIAKGVLSGKYNPDNPPPGVRNRQYGSILKNLQPLIKLMIEIGQDLGGKTPSQVALNWTICKGTLPIPGAKNLEQAEENAGAAGWRLSEEQVVALDEASLGFTRP